MTEQHMDSTVPPVELCEGGDRGSQVLIRRVRSPCPVDSMSVEHPRTTITSWLEQRLRRWKPAIIGGHIRDNLQIRAQAGARCVTDDSGSTHARLGSPADSVRYIDTVVADYLRYARLTPEMLQGARILEVGPGDSLGVALKLIALGAAHVTCIDKFYSRRDNAQHAVIYHSLRRRLTNGARKRFDQAITLGPEIEINPERLRCIYGTGIEQADRVLAPASFDLIVSRAVLECVSNPDAAFTVMDWLLRPGGLMAHKIDLRDHGLFSARGLHPLTFMTVPGAIYKLMSRDSGKPNRCTLGDYRRALHALGYRPTILYTHVTGRTEELVPHRPVLVCGVDYPEASLALIDEIRPKLPPPFRGLPDHELLVGGIFVVARKSGRCEQPLGGDNDAA